MSKYIDLELALNELLRLYEEDVDAFGVEVTETFDYHRAREALFDLPTIEVSEDCISRVGLFEKMQSLCTETDKGCGDCHKACDIEGCLDFVMDAPRAIPQVPSEDAISREDAVNALIAHFIPQTYTGEQVEQAQKLARKIMANAPSVIPQEKEGEWIEQEDDYHHYWECSECGMGVGLDDIKNFCPNCGSRMRGGKDE